MRATTDGTIEVRLFPLDGVVLLPGGLLPLHIFEPRYRQMVRDTLASGGRIAIAMPLEEEVVGVPPAVAPTIGVGRIVDDHELPDGRFLIVLQGETRARIKRELHRGHPYRTVAAEPLADDPLPDPARLEECLTTLRILLEPVLRLSPTAGDQLKDAISGIDDPARLVDVLGATLVANVDDLQTLLETTDVVTRIEILLRHVAALGAYLAGEAAAN